MSKAKIGIVTIGQSPRVDLYPDYNFVKNAGYEIIEIGALDGITEDELLDITPETGEIEYVSRLNSGSYVVMGKSKVVDRLQQALNQIDSKVDVIILLCTGEFTNLTADNLILYPDKIVKSAVDSLLINKRIGIVVPTENQIVDMKDKWEGFNIEVVVANPYTNNDISEYVTILKDKEVELVVLDCMGYTGSHKQQTETILNIPVILPRTLVARVAMEIC